MKPSEERTKRNRKQKKQQRKGDWRPRKPQSPRSHHGLCLEEEISQISPLWAVYIIGERLRIELWQWLEMEKEEKPFEIFSA